MGCGPRRREFDQIAWWGRPWYALGMVERLRRSRAGLRQLAPMAALSLVTSHALDAVGLTGPNTHDLDPLESEGTGPWTGTDQVGPTGSDQPSDGSPGTSSAAFGSESVATEGAPIPEPAAPAPTPPSTDGNATTGIGTVSDAAPVPTTTSTATSPVASTAPSTGAPPTGTATEIGTVTGTNTAPGTGTAPPDTESSEGGCNCRVGARPRAPHNSLAAFGLGLLVLVRRRRGGTVAQ